MGSSVVNELEPPSQQARGGQIKKIAVFAAKLLVTGACFWYASRQIDLSQISSAIPRLDFRWAAFAALVVMLQIPLLGVQWCNVVEALIVRNAQMNSVTMIVLTAIGVFFAQVLPSLAGEGVRAWFLVRLGCDRRNALTSVLIDRGIGLGLLVDDRRIERQVAGKTKNLGNKCNVIQPSIRPACHCSSLHRRSWWLTALPRVMRRQIIADYASSCAAGDAKAAPPLGAAHSDVCANAPQGPHHFHR